MDRNKVSMMETNLGMKKSGSMSTSRLKLRKQSYGFGAVASISKAGTRTSQIAFEFRRPPLLFHNTYQLDSKKPFHPAKVTTLVQDLLQEYFTDHKYDVQESPALALRLAGHIMRECKAMCFERYRIISVVTLGQKRAQSFVNAISFIWDHERDNYVDVQKETSSAFIQVTVFGVYLD